MESPITPRGRTPKEMVLDAAHAYFEADSEDDGAYEARWHRFRMAMHRYVAADKPNNPHKG